MNSLTANAKAQGLLWLVVTIFIWGAYMPVGKTVTAVVDIYWITAIRYTFAGLFLALIVLWMEGPDALVPRKNDLATLLLIAGAVVLVERGRSTLGAALLGVAGLTRVHRLS